MAPAQIKRRAFMSLIAGVAAWPVAARAQQSERVRRLGLLQGLAADDPEWQRRFGAFKQGLQDLGWTEGQNITFEGRFADGKPERLGALAAELVAANVDVIVTNAAQSIEAARKATSTIPIVMASVGDALGAGYVASLARPGANVTGLTLVATDQSAKRLQLLNEMVPNLVRVALFWNADASGHRLQLQEMELAAPGLGMRLQSLALHTGEQIDASLQAANAQAFFTMDDPLILSQRTRILEFATRQRLPVMGEFRSIPEAGGLASYGPNLLDMWRRAALYVDKIFRGAKPADLPVEQPTKFELVINLKTAAALGLTLAPGVLAIADEVIE
jgi:putative tryptophan/tyrosine transport system substrate-binding protein